MADELSEDQRRDLYLTLLRAKAKDAQDALCAADKGHAWGRWWREPIYPKPWDHPCPVSSDPAKVLDMAVYVRSTRHCQNCGKEEVQ